MINIHQIVEQKSIAFPQAAQPQTARPPLPHELGLQIPLQREDGISNDIHDSSSSSCSSCTAAAARQEAAADGGREVQVIPPFVAVAEDAAAVHGGHGGRGGQGQGRQAAEARLVVSFTKFGSLGWNLLWHEHASASM